MPIKCKKKSNQQLQQHCYGIKSRTRLIAVATAYNNLLKLQIVLKDYLYLNIIIQTMQRQR
jgi:hypothetical protein